MKSARRPGSSDENLAARNQNPLHRPLPISKRSPNLPSDKEPVDRSTQGLKANFIFDEVTQSGPGRSIPGFCRKLVPMTPPSERPQDLLVLKEFVSDEVHDSRL
jgi:hypothetical protein